MYEACAEAEERRAWRGSSSGMHERRQHDDGHQRRQTTSLHTPIDSQTAVAHTRHTIAIRTLFHHPTAAHAPHAHHHHRRRMPMWGSREKQRSKRTTIQARQPTYTHSTSNKPADASKCVAHDQPSSLLRLLSYAMHTYLVTRMQRAKQQALVSAPTAVQRGGGECKRG